MKRGGGKMVAEKSPKELFALSFTVAGAVLMIVGLISLALSGVARISNEEIGVAEQLPSIIVSIFLIAVGVIFASVGFFTYGKGGKKKR